MRGAKTIHSTKYSQCLGVSLVLKTLITSLQVIFKKKQRGGGEEGEYELSIDILHLSLNVLTF